MPSIDAITICRITLPEPGSIYENEFSVDNKNMSENNTPTVMTEFIYLLTGHLLLARDKTNYTNYKDVNQIFIQEQ